MTKTYKSIPTPIQYPIIPSLSICCGLASLRSASRRPLPANHSHDVIKGLLDINTVLCRSLDELAPEFLRKRKAFLTGNLTLIIPVGIIPN